MLCMISRLLQIIRLFCRVQSLLLGSFAKETYNLKEPTNRSHPIATAMSWIFTRKLSISTVVIVYSYVVYVYCSACLILWMSTPIRYPQQQSLF